MFKRLIEKIPSKSIYVLSRIGMFYLVNVFAIVISTLLTSFLSTVLAVVFEGRINYIVLELVPAINSRTSVSILATLIIVVIMFILFWDDGKKHAIYDKHNMGTSALTVLLMFAFYLIPVFIIDLIKYEYVSADSYYSAFSVVELFYIPCGWIQKIMDLDIVMSTVMFSILISLICIVVYKISGDRYYSKISKLRR